jgi:hypothetical protein
MNRRCKGETMKRITPFLWSIALIVVLGLGIYAGAKVTAAYKDTELMDIRAALEAANASLAEAAVELSFWRDTVKHLADGDQLKEIRSGKRPDDRD